MDLGLENTRDIIKYFPINLNSIRFIQVAGTNGKGSTAYFLASMLQTTHSPVGLFTSPHLYDVCERIIIDNQWIPKTDFTQVIWTVKQRTEELLADGKVRRMPTYFEMLFIAAIYYFHQQQVKIAVLEVGLGGRLDATTVITPEVAVITTISRDHTAILGKRLAEIAREKGGIIKDTIPVVCGCPQNSLSHREIKKIARQHHAPFYNVLDENHHLEVQTGPNSSIYHCTYTTDITQYQFQVEMSGEHQAKNAAVALKTMEIFNQSQPNDHAEDISQPKAELWVQAIARTRIPGRIEEIPGHPPVILDGGHNIESISALTRYLATRNLRPLTLVFGVLADKNYRKMTHLLLPFVDYVILTQPQSPRALPPKQLVPLFKTIIANVRVEPNIVEAYHTAKRLSHHILVTGSFYLVGAMRQIIASGG